MNCSVPGCGGRYQRKPISQILTRHGQVIVVEDIPAQVCDVCGDTLLAPEVVEQLVKIEAAGKEPLKLAPVFKYKVVASL